MVQLLQMSDSLAFPGASIQRSEESSGDSFGNPTILPSQTSIPTFKSQAQITPLMTDERVITRLLERLLQTGGLSVNEAARMLGLSPNSLRQYMKGRRKKPSLWWFIRLAELCGARVSVEFKR
jgi:hypothetical protein